MTIRLVGAGLQFRQRCRPRHTCHVSTPFPAGFFDRADESSDERFYAVDRLLTHIDSGAIAAVTDLYDELGLTGDVLDLCSSWISHFSTPPQRLVALGMNPTELAANEAATTWLVHDLNVEPSLPFDDGSFDAVTCCASVDYLTRPLDVFADVARVLRPGRRLRLHVLEPLLSHQGNSGMAVDGRRGPLRDRQCVLRLHRRFRRGAGPAAQPWGDRRPAVRRVGTAHVRR